MTNKATETVTTGSVFDDLDFDPGEAEQLKLKAALFDTIVNHMKEHNLTQQQAADAMGVQRSRVGDICRGKTAGFTIDALVAMAARVGLHPLQIAA
ncbi:XRE family transcriptional regulator [bacterium SCSIO 12696]|nr:XRE family transcriptional regulator [bacterium SCSIO 12696]